MLNKLQIIGRLGADPETRYLPSGDAVTNIKVATTEKWKDKTSGEMREETEWHRVSFFGRLAEIAAEYLVKGSLVFVEGSIKTRKWTDNAGVEKYSTEVKASELKMLSAKPDGAGGGRDTNNSSTRQQRPAPTPPQNTKAPVTDGDVPF
jgi:single-strand DNA-binding protein